MRFSTSIPVPQGYSAYSAMGGIAVPEPGPIAGSCVALLAMLFGLRRTNLAEGSG